MRILIVTFTALFLTLTAEAQLRQQEKIHISNPSGPPLSDVENKKGIHIGTPGDRARAAVGGDSEGKIHIGDPDEGARSVVRRKQKEAKGRLEQGVQIGHPGERPPFLVKNKKEKDATPEQSDASEQKAATPPPPPRKLHRLSDAANNRTYTPPQPRVKQKLDPLKRTDRSLLVAPDVLKVDVQKLANNTALVGRADVHISTQGGGDLSWQLTPIEIPVFLRKLSEKKDVSRRVTTTGPAPTGYQGVIVKMFTPEGKPYGPVMMYQNAIVIDGTPRFLQDKNRDLEFWLFGTAKTYNQRVAAAGLLDIFTFKECLKLDYTLVETTPRQCIVPDGTTFLEVNAQITEEQKKIRDFDACALAENPIIDSFPRKCVAPGGRIYVEPPRLRGEGEN